jgi:hypothetical protein
MEKFMSHYESKKTKVHMEDGDTFTVEDTAKVLVMCHQSIPDFKVFYEELEEKSTKVIIMDGVQAMGTHTGAPFTILPGVFPAVPATGKLIHNDEERWIFKMRDGKICRGTIISMGVASGFAGIYTSAGGSLVPTSPPSVPVVVEEETNE